MRAVSNKTQADVKCYFCGKISGILIQERTDEGIRRRFQPAATTMEYRPQPGKPLRCIRCGGPVYLDDPRPVPVEEPPFQFRQRRPKQPRVVAA